MNTVKIKAYAKVNLTLDILGAEGGYHLLDSFVASVDMYDLVVVRKRRDKQIFVTTKGMGGEGIPMEENNAFKAGEAFVGRFSTCGADITVFKNIPMGAGLGGSSADAAGVINGMAKLYGIGDRVALNELSESLGSDTRYMLDGGFCRMQGRGEKLTPVLSEGNRLYFLLLCPKSAVSAGACYREYDREYDRRGDGNCGEKERRRESATSKCLEAFERGDLSGMGRYLTNALYPAAARLNPDVEKALAEANGFSPLGAAMTGSGSCVFAMFETRELCEWAKSRYQGKFRAYVAGTVEPGKKRKIFRSPFALSEEEKNGASDDYSEI